MGGWIYYVNNLSTDEGVADYSIKNGDTIVMFFTENFMENIYSWFDIEKHKSRQVRSYNYFNRFL